MDAGELAFYTTRELIDELIRRKTFLGVVVHAEQEQRGKTWNGEKMFQIHFNSNLQPEEAGRLLDAVAEHLADTEG